MRILKACKRIGRFFYQWRYYFLGAFTLFLIWYIQALPKEIFDDPVCTVVRDRKGNILSARIADDGQWRFPHNTNVPKKFKLAVIQFEDRNFYSHWGISLRGIGRAIMQNSSEGRVVSGGSTITMQVMRMSRKGSGRNIWNKTMEAILATRLEWSYDKDEILALWASNAPMGGNVVGLDAAAWRYFGRTPDQLSWAEATTLAVLPNAPSLIYPGKNQHKLKEKRDRVLDRLYEIKEIDSLTWILSKNEPLPQAPPDLANITPHLTDRLMREGKKGEIITTTIDKIIQKQVNSILEHHQKRLSQNEIYNAACVIVHIESGEVIAYAGNVKSGDQLLDEEHQSDVDVINSPRSSGSILKPFLYAAMLTDGLITPEMLIPDVPTHISGYAPKNFSQKYDGMVPANRALSRSLNIPIVKLLQQYGVSRFLHLLRKLGFSSINRSSSNYGLSLILGGAEVTLWDLASVYAQMGRVLRQYPDMNSSITKKPHFIFQEENTKYEATEPLLNPAAIYQTFQAMIEVNRPDMEANWEMFQSSSKIAWKTGTSFGFRDAWAVGLNKEYVVAVWVGNADGEGRPGLTGLEAAAPILFDVFNRLPKSDWYMKPYDDMKEISICRMSGHRSTDLCKDTIRKFVPITCLNTTACPYHQLVHLDKTKKYRVDATCQTDGNFISESWFVLPPVMEFYYKSKNPNYHVLPEWRSDCHKEENEISMEIIYPKKNSQIYLPTDVDGEKGKVVFEVAHRQEGATVYWHLDEDFLGTTEQIHQIEARPKPGKHKLTVMDEEGNIVIINFQITNEK